MLILLCDMLFKVMRSDQITRSNIWLMNNVLYISLLCHFDERGTSIYFMTVHQYKTIKQEGILTVRLTLIVS